MRKVSIHQLKTGSIVLGLCLGLSACAPAGSPSSSSLSSSGLSSSGLSSPWHLMLSHDDAGEVQSGSVDKLVNTVRSGCQHRIAWGGSGRRTVEHVADVKWITVHNDNELKAQIGDFLFNLEIMGEDFPRAEPFGGTDSVTHWRATLKPDGSFNAIWYKPHSGEMVTRRPQNYPMKWYADCNPGKAAPLYPPPEPAPSPAEE